MTQHERSRLVARIVSGCVRCHISYKKEPVTFLVKQPTREERYIAEEIFFDELQNAELSELYSEEELYDYLVSTGWTEEDEELLTKLPKDIEQFKLNIWKFSFKTYERDMARKYLAVARGKLEELWAKRHEHDHLSCLGFAKQAKANYLLGKSLYELDGTKVFPGRTLFEDQSNLLTVIQEYLYEQRINETEYRELARNDPWRSMWLSRNAEGTLFGTSVLDYTEEQQALVSWSQLYDNIYEHPDCPSEDVIKDDDMLDGWMIEQRKKREQQRLQGQGEEIVGNKKIRGMQEIYLVGQTKEDADRIDALNSDSARFTKRQRFRALAKKGEMNELEMPDTAQRLQMEITQMRMQKMKGT